MRDFPLTEAAGATDILVLGTGSFAARIAFDLAAVARQPTRVVIAGRNLARLAWIRTAANARGAIFATAARFETHPVDLLQGEATEGMLRRLRPAVVVQAASVQPGSVIAAARDRWAEIVAEGGLSASAVFQVALSARVAGAVRDVWPQARLVNCCFPDVVNPMLAALGLPITCGTGNVAILANAFAGVAGRAVRVLSHYQNLGLWRQAPAQRLGSVPRVWFGENEVGDVLDRFRDVQLTAEPALDISGAAGVPLFLAMAHGQGWTGHVPGPLGLPGGYPVRWDGTALGLDLPVGLSKEAAVAWNVGFEVANGIVLEGTRARYTGRLHDVLQRHSPDLATGFDLTELGAAVAGMADLRDRLRGG